MTPRSRLLVAVGLLTLLGGLAGCSAIFGPSGPNEQQLNKSATYDWNTDTRSSYTLTNDDYRAVINVTGTNETALRLYSRDSLGTEHSISISALQFRYPNGTQVNFTAFQVNKTRKRTVVTPPQQNGTVAFRADRPSGKRFSVPVFVKGTHNVTLPPQARVGIPLLSQASPGGYTPSVDPQSGRMTLTWDESMKERQGPIVARYYLQRDLWLFGGLFAVLGIVGMGGGLYYFRQIKQLERRREEIGLDVETDDDDFDDGGPPPGMG